MQIWTRRSARGVFAAALVSFLAAFAAAPATAEEAAKTERANGRVVSYDKDKATLTIKDKGKELAFHVTAEGSVLTRTTVTQNARPAKLDDLKPNAVVVVYWRQNASNADQKDARKIDMPNIPEGLEPEEGE
jgi:hypothetical protein